MKSEWIEHHARRLTERHERAYTRQQSEALTSLIEYVEGQEYQGYDPYDTLNSVLPLHWFGKWGPVLAIQFQKRNPVNIRPLIGIKKQRNPKGMGLLLHSYANLYAMDSRPSYLDKMSEIFQWLCEHRSNGYASYCWGYNFDWASPVKVVKACHPSIVATVFVAKGVFAYYQITEDPQALAVLRSCCDFVLDDLPRIENETGVCFSYTDLKQDCCFNANMLGAELLATVYSLTGEPILRDYARKATDFTLQYQKEDGRWNYSVDLKTGREREQIDFHQGYVLDSLYYVMKHAELHDEHYHHALDKGAEFYRREQFSEDGRSKWRLPREWPVEIHNQAQGILTFCRLRHLDSDYLPFAEKIAEWTIENMQDPEGYFYYQKHRWYTNKISYMRWSQAWMMLALSTLERTFTESG